jgi:hypothetical protein
MKVRNIVAAAGLSLTIASFSPPVWAQVGGAGSGATGGAIGLGGLSSPGMPAAGSGGPSGIFQQAPSAGQPGTQAPASAAPIGIASSDWMSNEGRGAAENSSAWPSAQRTNEEKRLRTDEKTLERDLSTYRALGYNIQPAAWEKWIGSEALARGDQVDAGVHFQRAATDLRQSAETGPYRMNAVNAYSMRSNNVDSSRHGNLTSDETNATNMHSNKSSRAAY